MDMQTTKINERHYEALRLRFGSHSHAARALGLIPSHYAHVRRSGNMSSSLEKLILAMVGEGAPGLSDLAVKRIQRIAEYVLSLPLDDRGKEYYWSLVYHECIRSKRLQTKNSDKELL
jgi:hypothetical protein